jgi:3,4-dihydroxy 2-butanone 4-phosphate synthase/GTP cyclohydrolase II
LVFEPSIDERQVLALIKGDVSADDPILCRMHRGSTVADTFSSTLDEGGRNLDEAIDAIERDGRGVVVYLPPRGDLRLELQSLRSVSMAQRGTLREYGLGAQVLRELGMHRLRLLTNNPKKIAGIQGFGLEVVESVPLVSMRGP